MTNKSEQLQSQSRTNLKIISDMLKKNEIDSALRKVKSLKNQIEEKTKMARNRIEKQKNATSKVEEQVSFVKENPVKVKEESVEEKSPIIEQKKSFVVGKFNRENADNRNTSNRNYNSNNNFSKNGAFNKKPFGQNGNRPYNNGERTFANNSYNGQNRQARPYGNNENRPYNNGERPFNRPYTQNRPFNNGGNNSHNSVNKTLNDFKRSADVAPMQVNIDKVHSNKFGVNKNKNGTSRNFDDGATLNKRKNIVKAFDDIDEERQYSRKLKVKKEKPQVQVQQTVITKAVLTSENVSVKDLSEKIGKTATEIVKKLFILGTMATINSSIDFDTASLVASDFGIELELKAEKTAEDKLFDEANFVDNEADLVARPPIITIMGHVDHGKTSLLDRIRATHIASNEAGGITQHIGAYTINKNGHLITFIDTPGHEAFTAMRARGAEVTDIAVLVVAADDGIMPQTIEAIKHIKASKVPMIVAINKMDKMEANVDRIKQQLAEQEILCEEWGGNTILVPVSAKTGEGIDNLLDTMLLVAEMEDLKANPKRPATGVVIEAKLDRGRGPVATILVKNGTLKIGNTVVAGTCIGKIRAMIDADGKNVVSVGPSIAVSVLGFDEVPNAGEQVQAVDEKLSKQIIQERKAKAQLDKINNAHAVSLDEFMSQTTDIKNLNVIIKSDVQGSLEALENSLNAIKNDEVKVHCIHGGVGSITETDILLAQASNAKIVAFNVKVEGKIAKLAEKSDVSIKEYKVIYDVIDDINVAVKALVKPKYKEVVIGHAEVRMVYKITGSGLIAGSYVKDGAVRRNAFARIMRNGEMIESTKIESVKVFKDDVKEVTEGFECGIKLQNPAFAVNDILEIYIEEEIK